MFQGFGWRSLATTRGAPPPPRATRVTRDHGRRGDGRDGQRGARRGRRRRRGLQRRARRRGAPARHGHDPRRALRALPLRRRGVHPGGGAPQPPRQEARACLLRRLRAVRQDAHRAGRDEVPQRQQAHQGGMPLQVLGRRLVRADEQQDGRRPQEDPEGRSVHGGGVEGGGHGPQPRGVHLVQRGDQQARPRVLAAGPRHRAPQQACSHPSVHADHGTQRDGRASGVADLLSGHAVR